MRGWREGEQSKTYVLPSPFPNFQLEDDGEGVVLNDVHPFIVIPQCILPLILFPAGLTAAIACRLIPQLIAIPQFIAIALVSSQTYSSYRLQIEFLCNLLGARDSIALHYEIIPQQQRLQVSLPSAPSADVGAAQTPSSGAAPLRLPPPPPAGGDAGASSTSGQRGDCHSQGQPTQPKPVPGDKGGIRSVLEQMLQQLGGRGDTVRDLALQQQRPPGDEDDASAPMHRPGSPHSYASASGRPQAAPRSRPDASPGAAASQSALAGSLGRSGSAGDHPWKWRLDSQASMSEHSAPSQCGGSRGRSMGAGSKDGLPAESAYSSSNCGGEQEEEEPGQAAHFLARPSDTVATPDTPVPIVKLPPAEVEANHRHEANGGGAGLPLSSNAAGAEAQQQRQQRQGPGAEQQQQLQLQGPVVEPQQQQLVSRVVSSNKPPLSNMLGSKPCAAPVQATGGQANYLYCIVLHCTRT